MTDTTLNYVTKIHDRNVLAASLRRFDVWRRRARGRAELARMSERELHDIGLSRAAADHEVGKPFWRA